MGVEKAEESRKGSKGRRMAMIKLLLGCFFWVIVFTCNVYLLKIETPSQIIGLLLIPTTISMAKDLIRYSDRLYGVRK